MARQALPSANPEPSVRFPGPEPREPPRVTTRLLSRDLNYNQLHEFPVAIRTLGRLQEL